MLFRRMCVPCLMVSWVLVLALTADARPADTVNHRPYADLLKEYVRKGRVDYKGFKKEEAKLDQYLEMLDQTSTRSLSRNDQLAFYINAYNAWTIKLVLGGYPGIHSIKELGGLFSTPWKKEICRIDGRVISLDDLEHKIIRPRFQDPRVHFAINCASLSCPPLRSEPYLGNSLDEQLDAATNDFINNPDRNRLEGHTLYVSKIFDWYRSDFKDGVPAFFLKYAEGPFKDRLESNKSKLVIEYLDYDWSLNDV